MASEYSRTKRFVIALSLALLPFGTPLLIAYFLYLRWRETYDRFVKHEVTTSIGHETQLECGCGSLKVINHSAKAAGFMGSFKHEWCLSARPCADCLHESGKKS